MRSIEAPSGDPVRLVFSDAGTAATNYWVESTTDLEPPTQWEITTNAVITPQGGHFYTVEINPPPLGPRFYRVVGEGGSASPIIISFSESGYVAAEGEQVLPMLEFDRPFWGTVYYRVEGTGDYVPVSGQLQVDGSTAVIPLSLKDNTEIGQLTHLNIILEPGSEYQMGTRSRATVTIDENDAQWEGEFVGDGGSLPFEFTMLKSGGLVSGWLHGDGSGFFPTNQVPATLTSTPDTFAARISGIPIAPEATLLGAALDLSLQLTATNGAQDQTVSAGKIRGSAALVSHVPGMPYLDTTNQGRFLLLKPQVDPATNDVPLVQTP